MSRYRIVLFSISYSSYFCAQLETRFPTLFLGSTRLREHESIATVVPKIRKTHGTTTYRSNSMVIFIPNTGNADTP